MNCQQALENANEKIDWVGVALSALFVFGIVFAVMESRNYGWGNWVIISSFILAAVAAVLYVIAHQFTKAPLIPFCIMKKPNFAATISSIAIWQGIILALTFIILFSQNVWGLTAIESGLLVAIVGLTSAFMSNKAGAICRKITNRWSLVIGFLILTIAYSWIALTIHLGHWYNIALPLFLSGFGYPLIMSAGTGKCMSSAGKEFHGVVSGLIYAFRNTGGAILFALMGVFYKDSVSSMQDVMWIVAGFGFVGFLELLLFTRVENAQADA